MKCSWCGKEFTVLYPDLWAYKVGKKWFCTWKCLRADEKKGEDEMPRMKKDGTPAKKPGPRLKKLLEDMPVNTERDMKMLEQLEREEKEKERLRNEMMGKPINLTGRFKPIDALRQLEEKAQAMTTEELKMAAEINEDKPLTAEERSAKYRLIPSRVETKTGTWEIIDGYKADNTLVGFRAKEVHKVGPLDCTAPSIILTVEEWMSVFGELEGVLAMMKL